MSETALLAILLILCGGAVGSFAAVLADRLPQDQDVLRVPSACRTCATPLPWRDKLPLLSFLIQGGKCRHCGAPIPRRLFYSEVLGMALAIVAILVAQGPLHMVLGAAYLWCLMALAICDLSVYRLPDALTGLLFAIGLSLAWEDPARALLFGFADGLAAAGIFWLIRIGYHRLRGREGLGLGDVKLMAGIGAALGLQAVPVVALVAALSAMALTLVLHITARKGLSATLALPFGAYLCGAAALVWAWP